MEFDYYSPSETFVVLTADQFVYDPVQGTLVFVKSALMTLIYMEKLASRKALLN